MRIKCLNKNEDIIIRYHKRGICISPICKHSNRVFNEYEIEISNNIEDVKRCISSCFLLKKEFKIEFKEGFIKFKYKKDKAFKGIERIIISFYIEDGGNSMGNDYFLKETSINRNNSRILYKELDKFKGGLTNEDRNKAYI